MAEWKQTETEIPVITHEIERISNEDARSRQLRQIPGFGPRVATATVAASGNDSAFRRGRDFAAWAGVVPRQYSTWGNQKLYGISGANLSVGPAGGLQFNLASIMIATRLIKPDAWCERPPTLRQTDSRD